MPRIAISYRREESQPQAGRIRDHLAQFYGTENVIIDFDLTIGVDFRRQLDLVISGSDILVVAIGKNWAIRRTGVDYVRIEIEIALKNNIGIIPVLLDGAKMPEAPSLPEGIQEFAYRNAAPVASDRDFYQHMERVKRAIDKLVEIKAEERRIAEETRKAEERRVAEEAQQRRQAEQAEEARKAEERRKAEEAERRRLEQLRQEMQETAARVLRNSGQRRTGADNTQVVWDFPTETEYSSARTLAVFSFLFFITTLYCAESGILTIFNQLSARINHLIFLILSLAILFVHFIAFARGAEGDITNWQLFYLLCLIVGFLGIITRAVWLFV